MFLTSAFLRTVKSWAQWLKLIAQKQEGKFASDILWDIQYY
jgi:hypothetical protein